SGTSPASAWRTLTHASRAVLRPGDSVLFKGGDTFTDSTLMPESSGAAGAPITFGSFGTGRATVSYHDSAVWFSGKSYLTFRDLVLTTGGSPVSVFASSPGGASTNIVLRDSVVRNTRGVGVYSANHGDSAWTVTRNTIVNTGDSGIVTVGANETFDHNTISHTGSNMSLNFGKHGIYAKGPNLTISNNDFSYNANGQAISLRFHGARVIGNTIHDTADAIAFFDDDGTVGSSVVTKNRAWNIKEYGFYYDSSSSKIAFE